jgi:uncharacterized membrane protein YbhN (UPF0104 family)
MEIKNLKASIYDILGYFLPGLLVILVLILLFLNYNVKFLFEEIKRLSTTEIFLAIIIAYIIGHLIQSISNILENIFSKLPLLKYISGAPSYQYLSESNKFYSNEFKKLILDAAKDIFKSENLKEKELFNLCYSLILQKGETYRIELFVSLYGFYRGLLYSCLISSILFSMYRNFILAIAFVIFAILFLQRYKRFRSYFEDYVYRDFYIYYVTNYKNSKNL